MDAVPDPRFLARLLETVEQTIVVADLGGRVTYWNRQARELFGYAADEVLGRDLLQILGGFSSPVEDHAQIAERLYRGERWSGELLTRRRDGSSFLARMVTTPIHDASGALIGVVGTINDVSDRRLLEQQIAQMQKIEAVGRLAGGIAHDFNNLVTAITSYSELLLQELPEDEPRRADVEEIKDAATRAARLTRQLLAFSRKQVMKSEVLDLDSLVAGTDRMLRRLIGEDIELETQLASAPARIRGDQGQLEQVMLNLSLNARDAMPQGGRLTVETGVLMLDKQFVSTHAGSHDGPHVTLRVRDTGCGMTAQIKARLFEPFFTTKEPGKGTGLGLSTVYGIVKQMEGYIDVQSELGRGTQITIYFPRVDAVSVAPATPRVPSTQAPHGTETLLLVEDEGAVRAVARRVLKRQGYTVLEATNGDEAIAVFEQHRDAIDLVITDVVMPRMNGPEMVERLNARSKGPSRVLFMSGYTEDAIERHGLLRPGTAFIEKPFTVPALVRKVREVLDA